MRVEAVILRRWWWRGLALLAAFVALVLLHQIQKTSARESGAELRSLAIVGCLAAAIGAPVAFALASGVVIDRLHRDRILVAMVNAGAVAGHFRRLFLAMGLLTSSLVVGCLLIAGALRPGYADPLRRVGDRWSWQPAAPAACYQIVDDGVDLVAVARTATDDVQPPSDLPALFTAGMATLLVVMAAGWMALNARSRGHLFRFATTGWLLIGVASAFAVDRRLGCLVVAVAAGYGEWRHRRDGLQGAA
ncbi:MAG: hypothetical protein IPK26_23665 [Planctomycetes bacterium]|nr:hypothetical protein [Planctomycetota bacterium]